MVRANRSQAPVAGPVAADVVDPLEVVEVDHREGERRAVSPGDEPLALELLLERPMVAEAGQRVAQGLGAGAVVRVLEDDAGAFELLGRLEDAPGQVDHEAAEGEPERDDRQGRREDGTARAPA